MKYNLCLYQNLSNLQKVNILPQVIKLKLFVYFIILLAPKRGLEGPGQR